MSTSWVLEGIRILILLTAAGIAWFGPIVYFIPVRLYLDQKTATAQRSVTRRSGDPKLIETQNNMSEHLQLRYYCCSCNEKQEMEEDSTCSVCGHRSRRCAECLATRSSDADRSVFITNKHLIFSPPKNTWTLADMGLSDDLATTPFAVSGEFPLFSVAAIEKMREELLTDEVQQKFQRSGSIVSYQLRGMVPKYAKFTYNAWTHPETLAAISGVAGIDLVPVMDMEISHVNILRSEHRGSIRNDYPVQWHRDDYPYVCVLTLGNTAHMTGGQTLLREGLAGISARDPPKMGSAYVLQGRCVEHAVQAFDGCTERITAVTSFRPRSPFLQDQTRLCNVLEVSNSSELCSQFYQYRMEIAIERLSALSRIINGHQVPGWESKSLLLGQNIEDIRQFLQETCEQLRMRVNGDKTQLISKASTINLKTLYSTADIDMYTLGLDRAGIELSRGVREQRDAGGFDRELARRIYESVDYILRLLRDT